MKNGGRIIFGRQNIKKTYTLYLTNPGASTVMNTITYSQRYLPHELHTKYHAVAILFQITQIPLSVNAYLFFLFGE